MILSIYVIVAIKRGWSVFTPCTSGHAIRSLFCVHISSREDMCLRDGDPLDSRWIPDSWDHEQFCSLFVMSPTVYGYFVCCDDRLWEFLIHSKHPAGFVEMLERICCRSFLQHLILRLRIIRVCIRCTYAFCIRKRNLFLLISVVAPPCMLHVSWCYNSGCRFVRN